GPSLPAASSAHHQIISIHGHRIQINEVSSSYVGTSKVLLTHANSDGTTTSSSSSSTSTATDSGDDENSASSTTSSSSTVVKQLVVPVLVKQQRSRKPPGQSSPSARVITIFYETRSSSRSSRQSRANRSQRANDLKPFAGGIVKRRKTVIRSTNHDDKRPLNAHPTAETLVRRALRSNGVMNTGASQIPTSAGEKAARKLVVNEFDVSTTTIPARCLASLHTNMKASPGMMSRTGCSTRRMRLDATERQEQRQHKEGKKAVALELLQGGGSTKRAKQLRRGAQ
uniref:Uncharacterized protein n=1 Tax=Anopheles maculatus TaxID=74869 RepID=A0A182SNK3_9DIPT